MSTEEKAKLVEKWPDGPPRKKRRTPGMIFLCAFAAVMAAFVLRITGVIVLRPPAPPASLSVRPGTSDQGFSPWSWSLGQGRPNGKGQALYWVAYDAWYLVQLPEARVLCVINGDSVDWIGGTAVGGVAEIKPGVPLLNQVPLIQDIPGIGAYTIHHHFTVDLANFKALPASENDIRRMQLEASRADQLSQRTLEVATAEKVSTEERRRLGPLAKNMSGSPGHGLPKLLLQDKAKGGQRILFDAKDLDAKDLFGANAHDVNITNPFFVTDDLVMFELDSADPEGSTVWQVSISTGRAEQVWPSAAISERRARRSRGESLTLP